MTKRLLSLAFALLFAVGIIPFGSINSVAAKSETYNVTKALKYAQKNWNNGIGLCADFASKCLQAGGVDIYGQTVPESLKKVTRFSINATTVAILSMLLSVMVLIARAILRTMLIITLIMVRKQHILTIIAVAIAGQCIL